MKFLSLECVAFRYLLTPWYKYNPKQNAIQYNPLIFRLNLSNAELYPICHLLPLLGAHPILHISRMRVNVKFHTHRKIM